MSFVKFGNAVELLELIGFKKLGTLKSGKDVYRRISLFADTTSKGTRRNILGVNAPKRRYYGVDRYSKGLKKTGADESMTEFAFVDPNTKEMSSLLQRRVANFDTRPRAEYDIGFGRNYMECRDTLEFKESYWGYLASPNATLGNAIW